ncbi:MAG TPA: 4-hydroxy-3-methylbut-2-enyl diphosphate reductase, partial [Myxococcota bacterium]|nr:4-hydroxy-3-methylbut-2-enyl diphosphate reductase [Myxococcota bacterium]
VLTQTTLSVDDTREIITALRARFPAIRVPGKDDICYATQNRQNAVKELARRVDSVLVVGAPSSSNSNRLVEVARVHGARAMLVEDAAGIDPAWVAAATRIGVSAGASTPELLVRAVCERLRELGAGQVESLANVEEGVHFALPAELRREQRSATPA